MFSLWNGSAQTGSELPDTQIVSLLSLGTERKICAVNFCKVSFQLNSLFSVIKTAMTAWLTLIWFNWFDWYLALDILVFDRNLNLIIFFSQISSFRGPLSYVELWVLCWCSQETSRNCCVSTEGKLRFSVLIIEQGYFRTDLDLREQ